MMTRENLKLTAVAVFCLTVGLAGPSVAGAVQKGLNADQVDGKHAVGAKAKVAKRKNKLVATNKQGYLPDNIVRGQSALRTVVVPANAIGDTTGNFLGANLEDGVLSTAHVGIVLPPSYRSGSPITFQIAYQRNNVPCAASLSSIADRASVRNGVAGNINALFGNGLIAQEGPIPVVGHITLRVTNVPSQPLEAGDMVKVRLVRNGGDADDACLTPLFINGAIVRF